MAKYSYEFKLKLVQEYLEGEGGYRFLCKKYGIKTQKILIRWVNAYNTFGNDGLMRSRKRKTYTFEFKQHVVELYLTREISYQELANQVSINNPPMICKWVNDYCIAGPDALKPKRKGRPPTMSKIKKERSKEKSKVKPKNETQSDYLTQLEEENLKLRIENAYLKELRRLRLEENPLKKKRE
jgi:transposase